MDQATNLRSSSNRYVSNDASADYEFENVFRRQEYLLPEMRLIYAVLTDAIECYQKYLGAQRRRERRIFRETEAWIESRDLRSPYSLEQICGLLQLDPAYLRRGLQLWRAARGERRSPHGKSSSPERTQRKQNGAGRRRILKRKPARRA